MMFSEQSSKTPVSRWVGLAGGLFIALLIATAYLAAQAMKKQEIEHWEQQMGGMTLVLAEQMTESLVPVSEVLNELVNYAYRNGVRDEQSFRKVLSSFQAYNALRESIGTLTLVDVATYVATNGDNINFTRSYPVPKINLADRDYFQHHRDHPGDQEYVSKPVRNKGNGKWTFYMSRRINAADGRFLGVVLVGVAVPKIASFHEKVVNYLGENATITLFRNDLTMLSRWPINDSAMGKVADTGTAYTLVKKLGRTDGSVITNDARLSSGTHEYRMGSIRPVRRYPLTVLTVITDDVYLATWKRAALTLTAITIGACLLLGAGLFALVRSLQRREADVEKMRRLQQEAEQASQAKSGFLATMSHEIRTPMNGILGMAQLMELPGVSEAERMDYSRTIIHSGRNLMALLNDILDFSKMDAGKLQLHLEPCSIQPLLEESVRLFAASAQAKGLGLGFVWHGQASDGFEIDAIRVRQMINNLLNNAIKFSHRGQIQLSGRVENTDQGRSLLRFEVSDEGIGVSEEDAKLLFKPFSQVDSSSTRNYGGTGLGLSTVHGLAQLMGGEVGVIRHTGPGSTFWFTLEAQPTSRFPTDMLLDDPLGFMPQAEHGFVLVAEDDATNHLVISAMLQKAGYRIMLVENGQEALHAAITEPRPSLVFMDVQMPVMDGLQSSRSIRHWEAEHQQGHVPIVALTAAALAIDREQCLRAGMNDFLPKPVMLDALRHVLDKYLRPMA